MTLIDLVLAFALVVVVPLSIRLRGGTGRQLLAVTIAGGSASLSLMLAEGVGAAMLAAGWIIVPGVLLFDLRDGSVLRGVRGWAEALPVAYLLVGTSWFVLSRLGARPLGYSDEIVELTAVHFHYAGFAAPTITATLLRWLEAGSSRPHFLGRLSHWAVLLATPTTAVGISISPAIGVVGAAMFGAALSVVAVITLGTVRSDVGGRSGLALSVSSLSVGVAMALALLYAFGQWLGTPAPNVSTMARTHGVLNAFGFCFLGLVGWLFVEWDSVGTAGEDDPRPPRAIPRDSRSGRWTA
jgi:hypothetical protein